MTRVSAARLQARVLESRFGRAVLAISGATIVAQAMVVAAAPLLTRLYSPEAYGGFFLVNSVGMVLAAGFALRLELAIPLPADDRDARDLATLATAAIAALLLLTVGLSLFGSDAIADALSLPGDSSVVLFVGPLAATFALYATLNSVAIREQRYGAIARRQLVVASVTVALQLAGGLLGGGAGTLATATLLAQLLGAASLCVGSPLVARGFSTTRDRLRTILKRYARFPLLFAPAGWLNSLGAQAPLLVIGALYATEAAGWFGLTLQVVALPAALIGTAVAQVFVSELALQRRERRGAERGLFMRTSRNLAIAGLAFGGVLVLLGPWAFDLVFGAEWAPAGDMVRAYALAAAAQILASPLSGTLVVYERAVLQLVWDLSRLLLTAGSVVVAWQLDASVTTAVWALSVATALCYAANWEACRRTVTSRPGLPEAVTPA